MERATKLSSEFSPLEKPNGPNEPGIVRSSRKAGDPLSPELVAELQQLQAMPDAEIDFSDIPRTTPEWWRRAIQSKSLERVAFSSSPLLAKRSLTLVMGDSRTEVDVEIGPLQNHADDASCHVYIRTAEGNWHHEIHGIDGVQALQLALRFAGSELERIGGPNWECSGGKGHGFETLGYLERVS